MMILNHANPIILNTIWSKIKLTKVLISTHAYVFRYSRDIPLIFMDFILRNIYSGTYTTNIKNGTMPPPATGPDRNGNVGGIFALPG